MSTVSVATTPPQNPACSTSAHTQPHLSHFLPGLPTEQQSGQYKPGSANSSSGFPLAAETPVRTWPPEMPEGLVHMSFALDRPSPFQAGDFTKHHLPWPKPACLLGCPQVHAAQMCCLRGGTALLGRRPPHVC